MTARLSVGVWIVCWPVVLLAQPTSQPAATTRPVIVTKTPELCRGVIDPYVATAERARFLAAAGKDGQLDAKEFKANRKHPKPFVRAFDLWDTLLSFDKNIDGSVDWFEADAYRRNVRKRVLRAFDTDESGTLTDKERQAANKSLAGGKFLERRKEAPGSSANYRQRMLDRYDENGDGELSREERQAMMKDMGERHRQEMLAKYDTDGDGKISDEERKGMRKDRSGKMDEKIRAWELRDFDANNDGKIDEQEREEVRAFGRKLQVIGKDLELKMNDLDGDGEVTREERREARREWQRSMLKVMVRFSGYMDADGNGTVSNEETQNFQGRMQSAVMTWANKYSMEFDSNSDGRLGSKERDAMVAGLRKNIAARMDKFDNDQDGRLNPDETLDMAEDFFKEIGIKPGQAGKGNPKDQSKTKDKPATK